MSDKQYCLLNSSALHVIALSLSISALALSITAMNKPIVAHGNMGNFEKEATLPVKESSASMDQDQVISEARKKAVERLNAMRKQLPSNAALDSNYVSDTKSEGDVGPSNEVNAETVSQSQPARITSQIDLSQLSDRVSHLDYGGTKVVKIGYTDQGGRKSPSETRIDRANFAQKIMSQGDKFTFVYPARGEERARLVVFSDPTCPFCQKLHRDVSRLQDAGVTLHYMMFPRSLARGYNDPGAQSVLSAFEYAWCSKNPAEALDEVYATGVGGFMASDCSDVDQGRVPFPYAEHYFMVQLAGITATPVTITEDGREIQGYRDFPHFMSQLGL